MAVVSIRDPSRPIGDVIKSAGDRGLLLESEHQVRYALLPLDDDLIDFLIERNPAFRLQCREIRRRMDAGGSRTHAEVLGELSDES